MVTAVKYILCRELVKGHVKTDASGILMLQKWETWCLLWLMLLVLTTVKEEVESGFKHCERTISPAANILGPTALLFSSVALVHSRTVMVLIFFF